MYLEHFGLTRFPFSIAPDPDFLYPTQAHQEALAHLHYAFTGSGGLVCLTGEVGTGKTTVCRAFMGQLPENTRLAYIFNPQLSPIELLQSICEELEVDYPSDASLKVLYRTLNEALLDMYARGEKVICLIDEAQTMPAPLLEQVRLLTNLETSKEKLLTLILVGQPELNELLARYELRQLSQRITARFHLKHLNKDECFQYLSHRLAHSGAENNALFGASLSRLIWQATKGVPRLINTVADRVLLGTYAQGKSSPDKKIVVNAIAELRPVAVKRSVAPLLKWLGLMSVGVALLLSLFIFQYLQTKPLVVEESVQAKPTPVALLAKIHGIEAEGCAQLETSSLSCLWADWPLRDIQSIGLPAMIYVRDALSGEERWINVNASRQDNYDYLGRGLILWAPPEGYKNVVKPGQSSEVVAWVRERLMGDEQAGWKVISPAGKDSPANIANFYDPLLARLVAEFQSNHSLKPDQIIGPKTLIALQKVHTPVAENTTESVQ
ncbi:AAA family ATPase [Bacterioplanoides sp.]|uniref:ExeA family protein n=1 Tax=Bacterioplanoides sp. TaxID=2066072 RepID=UPI003B5C5A07